MLSVASSVPALLFRPTGKATRIEFVFAAGTVLITSTLLAPWLDPKGFAALALSAGFLWTMAVLVCKRLHDIGTSRAWAIGLLLAIIGGWSANYAFAPFIAFCCWLPALAFMVALVITPDGDARAALRAQTRPA